MSEPTSVLPPPPEKAATRAAVEVPIDASTHDVMRDATLRLDATLPLDDLAAPATISPGDADDLIARLADEQIDRLLAEEENGAPPPPPVPPLAVSQPPPLATAPIESTPIESTFVERRKPSTDAAAAFPASFSPPGAKPAAPIEATSADVFSTMPLAPAPTEAVVDAHDELRSDAAAVAAELADDLARSPTRVAAPAPTVPAVVHEEAASAIHRAVHAIGVVPTAIVDVINLPVRAANDAAREVIGAVAIVTLANAAALLLYLMIFQR